MTAPAFTCPAAHADRVLLDHQGLMVTYIGTGTLPALVISGPDGEIELVGEDDISKAAGALARAAKRAESFGPRLDYAVWRKWRLGAQ